MVILTALKNTLARVIASIYASIGNYTDALNQARAQSARFSGADW